VRAELLGQPDPEVDILDPRPTLLDRAPRGLRARLTIPVTAPTDAGPDR